jgi:hypothetical protein
MQNRTQKAVARRHYMLHLGGLYVAQYTASRGDTWQNKGEVEQIREELNQQGQQLHNHHTEQRY